MQKTLGTTVSIAGIGIHSGHTATVRLRPAPPDTGLVFVRTDLNGVTIPARPENTRSLDFATTLGKDDITIGTIEHLLAALYANGVSNLWIELDGPEVPVLDGSSLPFVQLVQAAQVVEQNAAQPRMRLTRPVRVANGNRWIEARPRRGSLKITCEIDFSHPLIGAQRCSLVVTPDSFARQLSPARTFGFLRDVEAMRRRGLALGGNEENCIVLDEHGVANGELRFRDEFVRHKALDLVGDLALLGYPLEADIHASKSGHALNDQLVRAILATPDAWEIDGTAEPLYAEQVA